MGESAKLLNFQTWIDTIECCNCGVTFGMPVSLLKAFRENAKYFYCPNGHPQHFAASEVERLKRELETTKANLTREIEWQRGQRQVAEKQLIVKKGQITKLKNRVSKGVCPCCQRSFGNLKQHMENKHPDFTKTED